MSQKNWKEILKELENANPLNDSLELGDSWRGLPRRTEGFANKTNGLYRRSVFPPVDAKKLYNFIIEKPPTVNKKTESNSANEAVASQPQKTMISIPKPISCGDADDNDSFSFTQFLNVKNDDLPAITSTPYPNRHTDVHKSPKRPDADVLRRAADSPRKKFLLVPTRILISTPRSSRKPGESEQRAPHKQNSDSNTNKMSSPIVSSTVYCSDDGDIEFDREKSPEQHEQPAQSRTSPESGSADQNCVPFDKDQQEQDACEKPSDEALFRRPQMVRQPSQNRKQLEPKNEQPADQSESSNNSQRNKQPKKVDILLDNYMKVGESLINKTNTVQSESSTSSLSRRKLYLKGDSCTEIDIPNAPAPVYQQCFELQPVPSTGTHSMQASVRSGVGKSDIQMGTTESNRSVNVADVFPKTSVDCLLEATSQEKLLASQQNDIQNVLTDGDGDQPETQVDVASSNKANKSLNDEPSQLSPSIEEDGDADGYRRKSISVDQLNPMSEERSNKQVLEQILQDWPDANDKQNDDEEGRSDASDSEQAIRHEIEKQPPKELIVRQVRSKSQKNPSAKNTQVRQTRANMRRVNENLTSEVGEETLTKTMYKPLRAKEGSVVASGVKKTEKMQVKELSKKRKIGPVDSNHSQENMEDNLTDSKEPMVAEPAETTRSLRAKKEKVNYVVNMEPWKKSRGKKRRTDLGTDKVKSPTKSQAKAKKIRLNVEEDATNEIGEHGNEDELPTESEVARKNKRLNVEEDENGNHGSEINLPMKSQKNAKSKPVNVEENGNQVKLSVKTQKKAKKKPVNVEEDATERNGATDGNGEEMPTKSRVKPKKKPVNVEEDATERNGETDGNGEEMPTKSRVKPKKKPVNVEEDATERNGETDGNVEEMPTKSRVKPKKKPVNVEEDATERNGETDGNGEEMPTKSRVKPKKKPVNVEEDATERNGETDGNVEEMPTKSRVKPKKKPVNVEEDATERNGETDGNVEEMPTKSRVKPKKKPVNVEEDATERNGETDGNVEEMPTKSRVKPKKKPVNVEEDATERNGETDGNVEEMPTKSRVKPKKKPVNVEEDATERNGETDGNVEEMPTKSRVKPKKKPVNVEEDATERNGETDGNVEEMPTKSRVKPKKKPVNVEEDATETADVGHIIEFDDNPTQYQTDGNANKTHSSTKPKSRQPRKRKQPADDDLDTQMSRRNKSVAKKHPYVTKWEALSEVCTYDSTKPRDIAPGLRHSTRERRRPEHNFPLLLTLPKTTTIVGSALRSRNSNVAPPKRRRIQSNEPENLYSMLLNDTNDQEPPLISRLRGIEIAQGFHKTVKKNLVIHHIPGETGPSYGYFTLKPGMVKPSCRISWNLHIQVVSGPVTIISENESETMKTGSFASLHSGTKYSLRNDGENSALLFFSQHWPENSVNVS